MFKEPHPVVGRSEYMLKRWRKHTIYNLSGSYKHPESQSWSRVDDPRFNMYSTNSIYLYDYVLVSDMWMFSTVYTSSAVDSTPASANNYVGTFNGTASYTHNPNTWINSPNAIYNNYLLRYNPMASIYEKFPVYGIDPQYYPSFIPSASSIPPNLTPAQIGRAHV